MSKGNGTTSQTSKTTKAPLEYVVPSDAETNLLKAEIAELKDVIRQMESAPIHSQIATLKATKGVAEELQTLTGVVAHIRDAVEAMAIRYHGQWYPERMRAVAVPFHQWQAMDEIERERVKVDAKAQGRDVRIIPSTGAMSPDDFDAASLAI